MLPWTAKSATAISLPSSATGGSCAGVAATVTEGVRQAREAVASGRALAKLSQFVSVTQRYKPA